MVAAVAPGIGALETAEERRLRVKSSGLHTRYEREEAASEPSQRVAALQSIVGGG